MTHSPKENQKQFEHSTMRLDNIIEKHMGDVHKIIQLVNLRTDRITNPIKLESWIYVIENQEYLNEAVQHAYNRLSNFRNS